MKKIISVLLACLLCISVVACSNGGDNTPKTEKTEKTEKATEAPVENTKDEKKEEPTEKATEAEKETEEASKEETEAQKPESEKTENSNDVKLEGPYIITTCGQSPGAVQISMAAKMAETTADADNGLTADTLDTENYKTLIVTTGTSMKGMGAAGTDVNKEIDRCVALIKKAQEAGMTVIGAHVEGMARRMDNSDQASIDAVMELVDTILIVESSNEDGFFTKYAEDNNKQLIIAKDAIAVGDLLK